MPEEGAEESLRGSPGIQPKTARTKWLIAAGCGGTLMLVLLCASALLLVLIWASSERETVEIDLTTVATFSPEIQATVRAMMDEQARGLDGAEVTLHRAYNYHGCSWMEPVEGAKLAAVDIGFTNYGYGFDLDDVDIIDGDTDENFGSNPDIAYPTARGEPFPDFQPSQHFGEPVRVLLIYAVRESTESIKLGYWGREIVSDPVPLEEDGLVLPEP